jgi:hypothetical protein
MQSGKFYRWFFSLVLFSLLALLAVPVVAQEEEEEEEGFFVERS